MLNNLDLPDVTTIFIFIIAAYTLYLFLRKHMEFVRSCELAMYILPWVVHAIIFYFFASLMHIGLLPVTSHIMDWSRLLRIHLFITLIVYVQFKGRIELWLLTKNS